MDVKWVIEWMKCIPQVGSIKNYVAECGWRCNANENDTFATSYGSCSFAVVEVEGEFVPYDELTEPDVLYWVWNNGVDKEAIEQALKEQIDNQLNPPMVIEPLPWAK